MISIIRAYFREARRNAALLRSRERMHALAHRACTLRKEYGETREFLNAIDDWEIAVKDYEFLRENPEWTT